MEVTYKYQIGQKVRIQNADLNWRNEDRSDKYSIKNIIGKEVTIAKRGFVLEDIDEKWGVSGPRYKDGVIMYGKYILNIFYYLEIEDDPKNTPETFYYAKRTRINEECLVGEDNSETVEEEFKTLDGYDIIPDETVVYEKLIESYLIDDEEGYEIRKEEANVNFTFANEGKVFGLRKNYELYFHKCYDEDIKEVETFRLFLCDFPPNKNGEIRPRQDGAKYGNVHWTSVNTCYAKVPTNYVEFYVYTALHEDLYNDINIFEDENWKWEIEQWLRRLKVYNKVKKLYCEKMPIKLREKTKQQKEFKKCVKKAKKYINSLTDEQKEIYLKILENRL